jgi:hypothetical protein
VRAHYGIRGQTPTAEATDHAALAEDRLHRAEQAAEKPDLARAQTEATIAVGHAFLAAARELRRIRLNLPDGT